MYGSQQTASGISHTRSKSTSQFKWVPNEEEVTTVDYDAFLGDEDDDEDGDEDEAQMGVDSSTRRRFNDSLVVDGGGFWF